MSNNAHTSKDAPVKVNDSLALEKERLNKLNHNPQGLGRWQRMRQYQPRFKLVRLLLLWWLCVLFTSLIADMDYFASIAVIAQTARILNIILIGLFVIGVLVVCIDVFMLTKISNPSLYKLTRRFPKNVAIFQTLTIEVIVGFARDRLGAGVQKLITLLGQPNIHFEFFDDYPDNIHPAHDAMPYAVDMGLAIDTKKLKGSPSKDVNKKISYVVMPHQRGTGYFGKAFFKVHSPLGLFQRIFAIEEPVNSSRNRSDAMVNTAVHTESMGHTESPHTIYTTTDTATQQRPLRVLANFSGLLTNELSAVFEKGYDVGMQTIKMAGHGSEFLNLRDYSVGDSMRQIDWKATSRQGRMMSKSYEDENDQDVVFLLDCGEQMRHKEVDTHLANTKEYSQNLNYFDKVLNAVLLLSYIANKQGDNVGLMTFGQDNEIFVAPRKGGSLIRTLLNETADIMPTLTTSDYYKAAERLNKSLKKRSLVIVITNTRQEANDELIQAMQMLSRGHQVVFANLTEQSLQDVVDMQKIPTNVDDALYYHSLFAYQQMRKKLHKRLAQQAGVLCLGTTASKLPMKLTEAYMRASR